MVTFSKVDDLPSHKASSGVMHRPIGQRLTVIWGKRGRDSQTPRHSHPHEQIA